MILKGVKESMEKTFSIRTVAILAAVTLVTLPAVAAGTNLQSASTDTKIQTTAAAPAALTVPAITVSKYGAETKGAFTVTWTDTWKGTHTYTLYRAATNRKGKIIGKFMTVKAVKDSNNEYTATDTIKAGKFCRYRLIVSEGKSKIKGALSDNEFTGEAAAKPSSAVSTANTTTK